MLSFITAGVIPAVPGEAIEGNSVARWTLEFGAPSIANVRSPGTKRVGYAASGIAVLMLAGFWIATKPDAAGPLAGARPMADVHRLICGLGAQKGERAAMERALLLRSSSSGGKIEAN
jgi:hypothetical protein